MDIRSNRRPRPAATIGGVKVIDTIDVFYNFPSWEEYNLCYSAIDQIARDKGQALYKRKKKKEQETREQEKKKKEYFTYAFANMGILEIKLCRTEYHNSIYMKLKPILLLYPGSYFRLSTMKDYPEICRKMNEFLKIIEELVEKPLFPPIETWHVSRIDYAFDIETPFVAEYISAFKMGKMPTGFEEPKAFDTSIYLKANYANINFYDKLTQAKAKFGLSDEAIATELHHIPEGILRLEVQCHNEYIKYMKKSETILDTALQDLFDEGIAREEVLGRVKSIVWKNDFFPYEVCIDAIAKKHKGKVMRACGDILRQLICKPKIRLADLKSAYEDSGIDFNKLTHIICKCGINAIPLEAIYKNSPNPPHIQCLINPYHLLVLDAGKA